MTHRRIQPRNPLKYLLPLGTSRHPSSARKALQPLTETSGPGIVPVGHGNQKWILGQMITSFISRRSRIANLRLFSKIFLTSSMSPEVVLSLLPQMDLPSYWYALSRNVLFGSPIEINPASGPNAPLYSHFHIPGLCADSVLAQLTPRRNGCPVGLGSRGNYSYFVWGYSSGASFACYSVIHVRSETPAL